MSSELLHESETVELKKSLAELEAIIVDKNQNALRWDTRALDKPWPDLITHKVKNVAKRAGLQWDALGDDD